MHHRRTERLAVEVDRCTRITDPQLGLDADRLAALAHLRSIARGTVLSRPRSAELSAGDVGEELTLDGPHRAVVGEEVPGSFDLDERVGSCDVVTGQFSGDTSDGRVDVPRDTASAR